MIKNTYTVTALSIFLIAIAVTSSTLLSRRRYAHTRPFTLMIDPAGDAKHAGRIIGDSFERGVTLQFAEALKSLINEKLDNIRVVLTRFPGETLEPLQNASFANRLGSDFYFSIHCHQTSKRTITLDTYHLSNNPITDLWERRTTGPSLVNYDEAHLKNARLSKNCCQTFLSSFETETNGKSFHLNGPIGLPFKPLVSVMAPAISIDVGLRNKEDWKHLVQPIADSLAKVLSELSRDMQ